MTDNIGPRTLGSEYGPYEPQDIGTLIDNNWRRAWPKVISRAWMYEHNNAQKALYIKEGIKFDPQTGDDAWYQDLLSHSPVATKRALMAEGMVYGASENAEEESWEDWIYTRIIVRTRDQKVAIQITDDQVIAQNVKITELETLKKRYNEREESLLVGSDLTPEQIEKLDYCLDTHLFKNEENGSANHKLFMKMLANRVKKKLLFNFPPVEEDNTGYRRSSLWYKTKSTGHFLALTLPPKPEYESEFAVALADYIATNKIYPFV